MGETGTPPQDTAPGPPGRGVFSLLGIAFRNLLRARRRNALAGGTMALGTAALILGNGLSDGIERQLTTNLVAVQTGNLQVVMRGKDFVAQNSPFDSYGEDPIPGAVALAQRVEREDGRVVRAVPFLHGRGTAIAGSRSSLAGIVGIEAAREPELETAQAPEQGSFLPSGDDVATYIASPMAHKLKLSLGDSVSFVVQTPKGAVNSLDATVCGIFRKGAPWYDNTFYISLKAAQALFDSPDSATNIKILLQDPGRRAARRARGEVQGILKEASLPAEARVETFDEAGRFSFSIIQANQSGLAVLSTFLFLAAALGITNAMLMSVHERTREIGTIRALGMRRSVVVTLFLLEGFALGLVSAAVGVVLGGSVVLYYARSGIPMNTVALTWMAGGDELYPALMAGSVLSAVATIVALSTLAAAYPARVASRLEPREALHHV